MSTYSPQLQARDELIFRPLVFSYRMKTAEMVAHELGISPTTARKRLNRLSEGPFLTRLTAWASDIPPVNGPLCQWQPADPEPDFGAIAYEAQRRWHNRPVRKKTVYIASRKLLAMYALPPRPKYKLEQATHDLALVEVYRYCRAVWPDYDFIGEDIFAPQRGHGEGVEDAQLIDRDRIVYAVEYTGAYRKHRVQHFHEHVAERRLPYLLF